MAIYEFVKWEWDAQMCNTDLDNNLSIILNVFQCFGNNVVPIFGVTMPGISFITSRYHVITEASFISGSQQNAVGWKHFRCLPSPCTELQQLFPSLVDLKGKEKETKKERKKEKTSSKMNHVVAATTPLWGSKNHCSTSLSLSLRITTS
jgi:hypothetical protein